MDNQLDFHVPLYSNFLLGMMKAIQIQHNNEHDDEEFVLGPQCLEATQPLVQLDCFCQLECHHHCCQLKFYLIGTTSTGDPSNSLT